MASLQDLKVRINSVKSTQKITKAMKMVAASKLKRAQKNVENSRLYTKKMQETLANLLEANNSSEMPELISGRFDKNGNKIDRSELLIIITSDRGLCGSFNSSVVKEVKVKIKEAKQKSKKLKVFVIGKKGYEQLKFDFNDYIEEYFNFSSSIPSHYDAEKVIKKALDLFNKEKIDTCSIIYNEFISAISQKISTKSLIPLDLNDEEEEKKVEGFNKVYEYEPKQKDLLEGILPRNLMVQIFAAMLESSASEHGARMTAMDNATRNAGEMINDLSLVYNRTRQASITTELIEIISGAEAL